MNQREKRLLIVDDDPELRDQVSTYLADNGFVVFAAEHGAAMDQILASEIVDLVVLDLTMPGEDGLSICRRLRDRGGPAVIMASAAGDETDRVLGLELGADDYLPKPFSPRELLARVRAVLRRQDESREVARGALFSFAGFTYDPSRRQLRSPVGAMILLTGGESSLLGALLLSPQTILTREILLGAAPGEIDTDSRAIDLQVSRLRRKLQVHGGGELIRTQRGVGYALDCEVVRR